MTLPKKYPIDKLVYAKSKHKNLYQKIYPMVKNMLFKVEKYRCYPHNDDFVDFKYWVMADLKKIDDEIKRHEYCRGQGCPWADAYFDIKP